MKIQFDTTAKTIKIEEQVNLGELIMKLEMLLPNGQWKEYSLEVSIIYNWGYPVVITEPIPFVNPWLPFWQQPIITCGTSNYSDNGIYNVQI
ncbi:MAG: hypothetical protein WC319_03760 [Candidatus Paceibacterota bacterium]